MEQKEEVIIKLALIKKLVQTGELSLTYYEIYNYLQKFTEVYGETISLNQNILQEYILKNFKVNENIFIAKNEIIKDCAMLDKKLSAKQKLSFIKTLRNYFKSMDETTSINEKLKNHKCRKLLDKIINCWQPCAYDKSQKDFAFLGTKKIIVNE